MIRTDRLVSAIESAKHSQSSLARAVGVTPAAIQQLTTGKSRRSIHLSKIAQILGVSESWLSGESELRQPKAEDDGALVALPLWSLSGSRTGDWGDPKIVSVSAEILGISSVSGINLGLFTDVGTAMSPTLQPADRVLVDLDANAIEGQNALWLIGVGDYSLFRRVLQLRDDRYRIGADNPSEPPIELNGAEFVVTGRVVGLCRLIAC